MIITEKELKNATLEAIYWWNRDEDYYHYYFSRLNDIYNNKPLLEFFTNKLFEIFLRQYSIRRNISAGYKNVDRFIDELIQFNFIDKVLEGNTNIIDEVSDKIKENQLSTKRQTKSLLSKIAFLINPNDFCLYDTLAKEAIWVVLKGKTSIKKYQLENYSVFMSQVKYLWQEIEKSVTFKNSITILNSYDGTSSFNFFSKNQKAFELRIIDKYLWLSQQKTDSRISNNNEYQNFIKL
jgi:hypothetical protein